MGNPISVWSFAQAFRGKWFAAMSGGFSVPFTALAVFLEAKYQQVIFGCLAFGAISYAAYSIWKIEREKVIALEAKIPRGSVDNFVKSQASFTLGEASCLLAEMEIKQFEITGPAAGFLSRIKDRILDGSIAPLNVRGSEIMDAAGDVKKIRNSLHISKNDLLTMAVEFKVKIPGLD